MSAPEGDSSAAAEFLQRFAPGGPWSLSAIDPEREGIETRSLTDVSEALAWIRGWQGKRNIYFAVNPLRHYTNKKAEDSDVAALAWLHADVDDKDFENGREGVDAKLQSLPDELKPTVLVDSGGGLQAFWKLRAPITVSGNAHELVAYSKALAKYLHGDHCWDLARVMRLPGTLNLPDAKKRAAGRKVCPAKLLSFDEDRIFELAAFDELVQLMGDKSADAIQVSIDWRQLPVVNIEELPVSDDIKGLVRTGKREPPFKSRSEGVYAAVCAMVEALRRRYDCRRAAECRARYQRACAGAGRPLSLRDENHNACAEGHPRLYNQG